MTIANIVVERDRALIGVDTMAAYMTQAKGMLPEDETRDRHTSKVSLYPHANMAMTGRGDVSLMASVRYYLEHAAVRDFEHATELMPELLTVAYQTSMAQRSHFTGLDAFPGVDVVLVGWSRLMRFEGRRWIRRTEDANFTQTRIEHWLALPEVDQIEHVDIPNTDARMEALARKQVAWANKNYPGNCGGRLMIAELTLGAASIRTIANLETQGNESHG